MFLWYLWWYFLASIQSTTGSKLLAMCPVPRPGISQLRWRYQELALSGHIKITQHGQIVVKSYLMDHQSSQWRIGKTWWHKVACSNNMVFHDMPCNLQTFGSCSNCQVFFMFMFAIFSRDGSFSREVFTKEKEEAILEQHLGQESVTSEVTNWF